MKLLIAAVTALLIGVSGMWAIFLERESVNVLDYLTTLFTGFAAVSTAYAAYSAASSAKISKDSANTWKQQIYIDEELREAKQLKVCLNDWHRRFVAESDGSYKKFETLISSTLSTPHVMKQSRAEHLQRYIGELDEAWSKLEAAFDRASFIGHNFDQRLRLRRLYIAHRNAVHQFIEYLLFDNRLKLSQDDISTMLTTIYGVSDWAQQELNEAPVYRVEHESIDAKGHITKCLKADGTSIYTSLHENVEGWLLNINVYIDQKITGIKDRVSDI